MKHSKMKLNLKSKINENIINKKINNKINNQQIKNKKKLTKINMKNMKK